MVILLRGSAHLHDTLRRERKQVPRNEGPAWAVRCRDQAKRGRDLNRRILTDLGLINRSNPQALPGRHPEFDNSGKIRKPQTGELLKAHGKEAFNEGYPEFKSHDVGLPVMFSCT